MQTLQDKQHSVRSGSSLLTAVGAAVLAFPLMLYAVMSIITSVNIPLRDDYDSIGTFVETFVGQHGLRAAAWWFLIAQHVQYKLYSLEAIVLLQYYIEGNTNYRVLQLLGDLAVPATVFILWLLFARNGRPLQQRIWLFVIPCYVFFAIRYAETVNWAMSGLQNLGIIPLALATIYFATSSSRRAPIWTGVLLVLSIATSGNGFFAAAVIMVLLFTDGRRREALWMLALTAVMATLYSLHYTVFNVYKPVPVRTAIENLLLFPFAFLGNCATSTAMAVALGVLLVAGFIFLTSRGWRRVCPGSFGAASFCLITAVGVSVTRYRGGIEGAFMPHYIMYSLLLIALEYIGFVRIILPWSLPLRSRATAALALAATASLAFCLWADAQAYRDLHAQKRYLVTHLILWERHPDRLVLVPDEIPAIQTEEWLSRRISFQNDLQRETAAGMYKPPYAASDPLPVRPHTPSTLGIEDEAPPPAR